MSTAGTIFEAMRDKAGGCGVLRYVGAKALSYLPFNGDKLKVNGIIRTIPSGGIAGLGNTASCFVNGTAAQALAANQCYYVYAFMNGATLTADFSTTARATSITAGNVGVEIKSGDDTRSLIGMVKTNASADLLDTLSDRVVRTWFNRSAQRRDFFGQFSAARGSVSGTPAELHTEIRSRFLIWKDEIAYATITGQSYTTGDGYPVYFAIGWDGAGTDAYHASGYSDSPVNYSMNIMLADTKAGAAFATENVEHYVTFIGWVASSGFYGGSGINPSIAGCIMGGV